MATEQQSERTFDETTNCRFYDGVVPGDRRLYTFFDHFGDIVGGIILWPQDQLDRQMQVDDHRNKIASQLGSHPDWIHIVEHTVEDARRFFDVTGI